MKNLFSAVNHYLKNNNESFASVVYFSYFIKRPFIANYCIDISIHHGNRLAIKEAEKDLLTIIKGIIKNK